MLFVCYPKCGTCKKAEQYLKENNLSVEKRDIKQDNPRVEELATWHKTSKLPLKRFFNTSGLQYKNLQLKDKLPQLTEQEQLELLASDGMLVKRPLLIGPDFVLVGFKEEEWSNIIKQLQKITTRGKR